jgi:hypothetical protein
MIRVVSKTAAFLAVLAIAAPSPAAAHPGRWYWSFDKVIRKLDGTRVALSGRRIQIHGPQTACTGEGRAVRRNGIPRWKHFRCIHATLAPRGNDIAFYVHIVSRTRLIVTNVRRL